MGINRSLMKTKTLINTLISGLINSWMKEGRKFVKLKRPKLSQENQEIQLIRINYNIFKFRFGVQMIDACIRPFNRMKFNLRNMMILSSSYKRMFEGQDRH